jgi:hypothetical protein
MSLPEPKSDYEYCRGQAEDGTQVCAYREGCKRFSNGGYRVVFKDFWKSENEDCPKYESLKHG